MSPDPSTSHWLIALTSGILGALITYILAIVTFRDKLRTEMEEEGKETSKKINKVYTHCESCRNECQEVRVMSEKELESKLQQGDRQFTYIRLLLEDVICEKLEIPRVKIERIRDIAGVQVSPARGVK